MKHRTLNEWFTRSAARHGNAVALEVGGQTLTYRQLERTAEAVAGELLSRCGDDPRRVGLYASRSVAAYAGYLAALRLGATVVPLNPSFPAVRNDRIVRSAALDTVIAEESDPGVPAPAVVVDPSRLSEGGAEALTALLSRDGPARRKRRTSSSPLGRRGRPRACR
ncbi:hypothetical protein GCM10020000_79820 [Streptomyces olivoverticillatus]